MRLGKYLALCGVASRRSAERLIASGRVSVDGHTATDPAVDVSESNVVTVDGERVERERLSVYAVNKPGGVVSTARDTHGRAIVTDLVPSGVRLYPVGRLDADTTGLILLTNDGELANLITHPRYGVPKTYRATLSKAISERAIESLRRGVELDDGPTAPARVRRLAPDVIEIVVREGRKRQVRRMCEAVGNRVVALERIAIGPLELGGLAPGAHRRLTEPEIDRLREAAR
jgi:23S rRNA pseudouridine2605 synthase